MFFYLAGSIEYSPDLGKGWRAQITPALKALGHEIYDPAEDEMKNLTAIEAASFARGSKATSAASAGRSRRSLPMTLISSSTAVTRLSAIGTNTPDAAPARRAS